MEIIKRLLTPNKYSRSQEKLNKITKIVVHYVGNPNSSAISNRNYFESLKNKGIYASAHYIIGLQGEIIQMIPENEIAYATYSANEYSLSIENCHPDSTGKFNINTRNSLTGLCVDICKRYNLDPMRDIIRHYDVASNSGYKKPCPLYWVNHNSDFIDFKNEVKVKMNEHLVDIKLVASVNKLVENGIISSPEMWNDVDKVNPKYITDLVIKYVQSKLTYEQAVDILVENNIISSEDLWLSQNISRQNCVDLIKKL